jgi:hypothetical protein
MSPVCQLEMTRHNPQNEHYTCNEHYTYVVIELGDPGRLWDRPEFDETRQKRDRSGQ